MVEKNTIDNELKRFLIISTGRSGSSLLSSIISHSGGEFNLPDNPLKWNPIDGAFEHPLLHRAYAFHHKTNKFRASLTPNIVSKILFNRRKLRSLRLACENARFLKSSKLVWLVHDIEKIGFLPYVIVIYRDFDSYAISRYKKFGWSYQRIESEYLNVYKTAILQQKIYGGCFINYYDLLCDTKNGWAEKIATHTNLRIKELLNSRKKIVAKRPKELLSVFKSDQIRSLELDLQNRSTL